MGVDYQSPQHVGVNYPSIPIDGVAYVLSGWSGQGSLFRALGAVDDPSDIERAWDERNVRNRADRILLEHISADLERWPRTLDAWLPYLPINSRARDVVSTVPNGRVDWRETVRRFGWPPQAYAARLREREIADVTVTTLAWTVAAIERMVSQARRAGAVREEETAIDVPLCAAREALALASVPTELPRPDRHDLESLLSSGKPWSDVEPVTAKIVRAETDLTWFAVQLLAPDPEFRWRLFHLAVLGHVLMALRAEGASIKWHAPMGNGNKGPNFVAKLLDGASVDVWFEAAAARAYYGHASSTYKEVVRPVHGSESAIGADIGVFIPARSHALLLECKFSSYGPYIARNGYHQSAGYALNEHDLWARLWSYVVGPEEKVSRQSRSQISGLSGEIVLGATAVPWIRDLVASFLDLTT